MQIAEIRAMHGPNYWSIHHPRLLVSQLDLAAHRDCSPNQIARCSRQLAELLPGLAAHCCLEDRPGGPAGRLPAGNQLAYLVERIAVHLQTLAGSPGTFGGTESSGREGVYYVLTEYHAEEAGRYALRAAVRIAEALLKGASYEPQADIAALRALHAEAFPGPSTHALLEEARRRNIPVLSLSPDGLYQLGYGAHQRRIRASIAGNTSYLGVEIAGNKRETKHLLRQAGIPVPEGTTVKSKLELPAALARVGFPAVIKPLDGHQGKGISVGIRSESEAREALELAQLFSAEAIVEQYIEGQDFRVLVVNGRFVAAALRKPAAVTGDGTSTIRELVGQVNADPRRGAGHGSNLTAIGLDDLTEALLEEKGLSPDSVLPEGREVLLKKTANLSTGGTATDVTGQVHPDNIRLAERVARIVGLDICGIDLMAPSLAVPVSTHGGAVIEVNAAPGLRMHLSPSEGEPRNVAAPILDMLFPAGAPSRIPIVAITGTNGKTTVARLTAHLAAGAGRRVGFTCTDGIYLDGKRVQPGDNTGPLSAQFILREPDVDFAVLECARGGLLRAGLGFDQCDVAIVTNVAADHLGQGGIHSITQMARLKAVLPFSVKPGGWAVLNADDDRVYAMRENLPARVALFSLDPRNRRLLDHALTGGLIATVDDGMIILDEGGKYIQIAKVAQVPVTFAGTAPFMTGNVLASVLAAYVSGLDVEGVRQALPTFVPSAEMTPGRMNLFEFGGFRLLVDYAHNPAGLRALGEYIRQTGATTKVGIVTGVGDRRDEDIREMGEVAAGLFDEVIIRFDQDLRGRTMDQILDLLLEGIRRVDARKPVRVFSTEEEALVLAVRNARPGWLVVDCTDKVADALAVVARLQQAEESSLGVGNAAPVDEQGNGRPVAPVTVYAGSLPVTGSAT